MNVVNVQAIECRLGNYVSFQANIAPSLPVQYTRARFVARWSWNDAGDAIFDVDESNGIAFDYPNNTVNVTLGATVTKSAARIREPQKVAAMLRLFNPADPNDTLGFAVPFELLPDLIG